MRRSFFFFFVMTGFAVFAQNNDVYMDTLRSRLLKAKEDTNKVKILYELTSYYVDNNVDEGFKYAEEAVALSQKLNWEKGVMYSKIYLGRICWRKGKFGMAIRFHDDALQIAEKNNYKDQINEINTNIGQDYADSGNYNEAMKYFEIAKAGYEAENNIAEMARCYLLLSWVYDTRGNFPESSKQNLEALKIYESIKDKYGIAVASANVALDYIKLGKHEDAIPFVFKSNEQYIQVEDYSNLSSNYLILSEIYIQLRNYSDALSNAQKALEYGEKINDQVCIGNAYSKMGDINYIQNIFELSSKLFEKANSSFKSVNASQLLANNYGSLAMNYIKLNKTEKAKSALDSAAFYNNMTNAMLGQEKYYNGRQMLDSLKGNWKDAYLNYRKYISIHDSIYNNDITKKMMQNQVQYEFDKKEAIKNAEQEKKDIRQRNIRNSIAGGLGGALVFLVVVYRQRNKINKARKRSDELLLNILPEEVADELKQKGSAEARQFEQVTVMFTDFKGFTKISENLTPKELVSEIHTCFKAFDDIIGKFNIEKIKTIGDSYMCAGGLPLPNKTNAEDVIKAALEIQQFMQEHLIERKNSGKEVFEIRIGIHTGPIVAGIVGVKKFAYDIWGDTVNIAARMEQNSEPGKINISSSTYELVKDKYKCTHRGKIEAKNKGVVDMYFLVG